MEKKVSPELFKEFREEINEEKIGRYEMSDIGNEIGLIVAKYLTDSPGWDKESFISGIKHGISLVDGTH